MMHLVLDLRAHQRVLEHYLQFLQVLHDLDDVQPLLDLELTFIQKSLELHLVFPAAVAAETAENVGKKESDVVEQRQLDESMLLHLSDLVSTHVIGEAVSLIFEVILLQILTLLGILYRIEEFVIARACKEYETGCSKYETVK